MTEQKHTPGPLMVFIEDGRTFVGTASDTPPVLVTETWSDGDARLIAAAPDLLKALERLVESVEDGDQHSIGDAVEIAIDAISKAQGEE